MLQLTEPIRKIRRNWSVENTVPVYFCKITNEKVLWHDRQILTTFQGNLSRLPLNSWRLPKERDLPVKVPFHFNKTFHCNKANALAYSLIHHLCFISSFPFSHLLSLSLSLYVYLALCLSVCLYISILFLSFFLSLPLSLIPLSMLIFLPFFLSLSSSPYLLISLSLSLSVCLSVFLTISFHVSLSLCLSHYLI